MTTSANSFPTRSTALLGAIWSSIKKIPPIYPVFLVIILGVSYLNPNFSSSDGILLFLRRSAPLAVLAIGQMFVLASGGFDLSQGSLVTLVILGSSLIIYNDANNAYLAIMAMIGLGVVIGLVNGLAVTYLKVPSLIATLGMLLLLKGGGLYWTGGAPKGYLTDNWRFFGRGYFENVPIFGRFPVAVLILLVVAVLTFILFHRTNLGKQILAIGDNARASQLSGVKIKLVRIIAFLISSVLTVIAGVMIGGYGGISIVAGDGLEMQSVSAAVIGGAMLLGGKGNIPNVIFGGLTLEALFNLLNLLGLPKPYRDAVQGLIIIGAVAYAGISTRKKR
ncbi:MAG TPA: ABC transporter permease [Anaerolineales bacterium]|nr:ABC transporter permease [Anaerolineales bacterium]